MRTRLMTASMTALALAGTLGLQAQTPQTQPPSQPQPSTSRPTSTDQRPSTTSGSNQVVTVSGCLKAEKDVPGRTPSVADRAGMGEDFVLTNVKMGPGSSTAGIGLASMYEIKGISDSELTKHVNHQVEVMGTLESKGTTGSMSGTGAAGSTSGTPSGTTPGSATGTTASPSGKPSSSGTTSASSGVDLPDLHATSIKMVAATCSTQ